MHYASKPSHLSQYPSLLFSTGYLRGSQREGLLLWEPLLLLDGAQGCKTLPSSRFNRGLTGRMTTFELRYGKGWTQWTIPLNFSLALCIFSKGSK